MAVPRSDYSLSQLEVLEAESIHIMREVAAEFERPVLLFSGGKDSIVMLRPGRAGVLAGPDPVPGHARRHRAQLPRGASTSGTAGWPRLGVQLVVASVQDSIDAGRVAEETGRRASRNRLQTTTLLDAIEENRFDAVFGGARRDEEKARAKERVFSFRDEFGQWDPKNQRPELWSIYNTRIRMRRAHPGVPAVQLDRAGRLAVHRPGEAGDPVHLLRAPAPGLRAGRHPARRQRVHHPRATTSRSSRRPSATAPSAT